MTGTHSSLIQYTGKFRKPVLGSDRGMYLEDLNKSLKDLQEDLQEDLEEQERDKPAWRRRQDPLKIRETFKSFDRKWAERCVDDARSFDWLNEWWGPKLQNPLRLSPRSGRHPSAQGGLTAQYNGGIHHKKRKSDPGAILPGVGKRPKKEHKRSLALQMEREDRRKSEPLWPPQLRDIPPWRPPTTPRLLAPVPKTKFCSFCGGQDQSDGSPLFLCERCNLVAYCSKGCQSTHALAHKSICKSAGEQSSSSKIALDMGNYVDDDETLRHVLAQSAIEVGLEPALMSESQWQASIASGKPKDDLPVNDCDIVDFKVDSKNRLLKYCVLYSKTRLKLWRNGTALEGDLWTGRMKRFWTINSCRRDRNWRWHLENLQDSEYYPTRMGRYVLAVKILEERNFEFFIQTNDEEAEWRVYLGRE